MTREEVSATAKELLEKSVPLIGEIVRWICARKRLSAADVDDFYSYVALKLVEDDFRRMRAFRGSSTLRTYLVTVIRRLRSDFSAETHARWRPSARATELGDVAVRLEELIYKNGYDFGEASQILRHNVGVEMTEDELWEMLVALPIRSRRTYVTLSDEGARPVLATRRSPLKIQISSELRRRVERALRAAIGDLDVLDALILRLRYVEGVSVKETAARLRVRPERVSRRTNRALKQLRAALEDAGITVRDVHEIGSGHADSIDWSGVFAAPSKLDRGAA